MFDRSRFETFAYSFPIEKKLKVTRVQSKTERAHKTAIQNIVFDIWFRQYSLEIEHSELAFKTRFTLVKTEFECA